MPSKNAHLNLANHNQEAIEYLVKQIDRFPDWITTVSFYKALHLVEALFAHFSRAHGPNHEMRERRLKRNPRYSTIYKHYRPLLTASLVARYLDRVKGDSSFSDYMSPKQVKSEILEYRLKSIEKETAILLG